MEKTKKIMENFDSKGKKAFLERMVQHCKKKETYWKDNNKNKRYEVKNG